MLTPPTLETLPPPPAGRTGWPWTVASPVLPAAMPDGRRWPRISIVTPSYNQGSFIEETIRSILLQGYPDLEYYIIDGGSSDGTVDTIKRYAPWLTTWVSERDRGQAHAINKGFSLSSGEIFQWINSDDFLAPSVLQRVAERCAPGGALAGGLRVFGAGSDTTEGNRGLSIIELLGGRATFCQPALWLSRKAATPGFPLDESLHYAFDLDMLLRILARGAGVGYEPTVLANFRLHEASKSVAHNARFAEERVAIMRKALRDEAFEPYHRACARMLQRAEWRVSVDAIRASGRRDISLTLMSAMAADPLTRIDRHALGALRRELTRELRALFASWLR